MNTYKIYKWTNLITGKGYVGQTCRPLQIRAGGSKMTGYSRCKAFWKAIQEYGTDCWRVEILREGLTAEEADIYEDIEIENHRTLIPNGYNLIGRSKGSRSQKSIELRENAEYICESYLGGMSGKEIAKQLGCSYPTILTILRENNVRVYHDNKEKRRTDIDENAEYICESYREGMPVKEIANRLDCCTTLIYRILGKHNVQRPSKGTASRGSKGGKKSSVWEEAEFICESYRRGLSAERIADQLGCSAGLIRNILCKNSVQMRPRGKGNKGKMRAAAWEEAEFICESYHEGMLVKEIANQLGCSMASIYRILHENNVQVQTDGKKHSVEHRKKNSEAQLGMSQEHLIFLIQWYSGWGWSQRRIARELRKGEKTIAKYAKLVK